MLDFPAIIIITQLLTNNKSLRSLDIPEGLLTPKHQKKHRCQQHRTHLSFVESLKAVTDGKHLVSLRDSHPDGRTDGSVHARRRSAHVQHRYIKVALWAQKNTKNPRQLRKL